MKRPIELLLALVLALAPAVATAHEPGADVYHTTSQRSPGIAAALSLTPMPVDFGNFYAENVEAGILFTTVEVGIMGAAMWTARWGGGMHGRYDDREGPTAAEREQLALLAGAYVAVKVASALQAADAAERYNARRHAFFAPLPDGAVAGVTIRF